MSEYTTGPWTAKKMHTGGFDVFDPRGRDVVTFYGGGVETESLEANARLAACSPELIEALKDCALQIAQIHNRKLTLGEQDALYRARAVIAKATGSAE